MNSMATNKKPLVIALEEHYWDAEVAKTFENPEARNPAVLQRLDDLGALRIKEMDEAGIDVQVISHGAPSTQRLDAATAVPLAKRANDRLHAAVRAHPERFAGFAALPTADPKAAAEELERTVTKLGFKGAMVHGPTNGVFFDDKRFWPIFERAQELDVPLYIHPSSPVPGGRGSLLQGLPEGVPPAPYRGVGLYGGDRHARHPHDPVGRIRQIPAPEDHPRAPRRIAAVLGLAHQHRSEERRVGKE